MSEARFFSTQSEVPAGNSAAAVRQKSAAAVATNITNLTRLNMRTKSRLQLKPDSIMLRIFILPSLIEPALAFICVSRALLIVA